MINWAKFCKWRKQIGLEHMSHFCSWGWQMSWHLTWILSQLAGSSDIWHKFFWNNRPEMKTEFLRFETQISPSYTNFTKPSKTTLNYQKTTQNYQNYQKQNFTPLAPIRNTLLSQFIDSCPYFHQTIIIIGSKSWISFL